jgi:hypothetical protein
MMLWLLATLSVVTISWGIAHRLKAVSPAANCTGERCSCRLDDRIPAWQPLLHAEPKDDPRTSKRALSLENPEPGHNTLGEQ